MQFDIPLPPTSAIPYLWQLTLGDDWDFGYTFVNPDGTPVNLTGAQPQAALFARDNLAPVLAMTSATSGVTVIDAVNGKAIFSATRALTATLRAGGETCGYPTRIQVMLLDSLGKLRTFKVDPIQACDARFQAFGPLQSASVTVAPPASTTT